MSVTLGIDFGSSYSFVVLYDSTRAHQNRLNVVGKDYYDTPDLSQDYLMSSGVQTVMGYRADLNTWVLGSQCSAHNSDPNLDHATYFEKNPEFLFADIKRRIRDIARCSDGTYIQSKQLDAERFYITDLEHIKFGEKISGEDEGEKICFGYFIKKSDASEKLKKCFEKMDEGRFVKEDGDDYFIDAITMARHFFRMLFSDYTKTTETMDIDCISLAQTEFIVIGIPAEEEKRKGVDPRKLCESIYVDKILSPLKKFFFKQLDDKDISSEYEKIAVINEPILAGIAYMKQYQITIPDGTQYLVIDIGGGTTDFAIVQHGEEDKTVYESRGDEEFAGKDFNSALSDAIRSQTQASGEKSKDSELPFRKPDIETAKKALFKTFLQYRMEQRTEDQQDIGKLKSDYKNYCRNGRCTSIAVQKPEALDGIRYVRVAFNQNHKPTGDSETSIPLCYYSDGKNMLYDKTVDSLCGSIIDYLKGAHDKLKKKIAIKGILFVGGTCNIEYLRDKLHDTVCEQGRQDGWLADDEDVESYFLKEEAQDDRDIIPLTYANLVAIGAAYAAEKHLAGDGGGDVSPSDVMIKVKTNIKDAVPEDIMIHSSKLYYTGEDDAVLSPFCFTLQKPMSGELRIQFRIGISVGKEEDGTPKIDWYPLNNRWYSMTMNWNRPEHNAWGDDVPVALFADYSRHTNELAVFICIIEKGQGSQPGVTYVQKFGNGLNREFAKEEEFKNGILPITKNCKKYTLIETAGQKRGGGKTFNIRKDIDYNQDFGWRDL